jgi:transposase-like protein
MSVQCPYCSSKEDQVKAGFNQTGSQRYKCKPCGRHYTPKPKPHGYSEEVRLQAVRLYLEGNSLRSIGRVLGVNHQSVANWVNAHAEQLPKQSPVSQTPEAIELDEMFSFISDKKTTSTS